MASNRDIRHLRLEPFSKEFALWLFSKRPDWLRYATAQENLDEGLTVNTLEVDIPSENREIPEPLTINVELNRIIVLSWFQLPGKSYRWSWDFIHYFEQRIRDRLGEPRKSGDYGFVAVLQFVNEFMGEEWVARVTPSTFGAVRPNLEADGGNEEEPWLVQRSWRGTYDRVAGTPPGAPEETNGPRPRP